MPATSDRLTELAVKVTTGTLTDTEAAEYDRLKPASWTSAREPFADAVKKLSAADPSADPTPANPNPANPNPAPQSAAFNVNTFDSKSVAIAADEHCDRIVGDIGKLMESIEAHAHDFFTTKRHELLEAGVPDADGSARMLAEQEASKRRAAVYAEHEARLLKEITVLKQHEDTTLRYASTYNCVNAPTTAVFITLEGLGGEQRNRYALQLANAGPAALKAAAEFAKSTNDATLAAAVFLANGAYPKAERIFSNDDLADRFYLDRARELHRSYVTARAAVSSSMSYLRSLASGQKDSHGKIERGVARLKAAGKAQPVQADPNAPLGNNLHTSSIRRGLDKLGAK